jgi:hypothetical protein
MMLPLAGPEEGCTCRHFCKDLSRLARIYFVVANALVLVLLEVRVVLQA